MVNVLLHSYFIGATASALLLGMRSPTLVLWMEDYNLTATLASAGLGSTWVAGKVLGLALLRWGVLGRYDLPCLVTVGALGSVITLLSRPNPQVLCVGYGLDALGSIIYGWWGPILLQRLATPSAFSTANTVFALTNIAAVTLAPVVFGLAIGDSREWSLPWGLRSAGLCSAALLCLGSAVAGSLPPVVVVSRPRQNADLSPRGDTPSAEPKALLVVGVVLLMFVLESYSYLGLVYFQRMFPLSGSPNTLWPGVGLALGGCLAVALQYRLLQRWSARIRAAYLSSFAVTLGIAALGCCAMVACRSARQYALVLFLWLNPSVCCSLCSAFYLVGTLGRDEAEQRRLTVGIECLLILCAQWFSPLLMGYVTDVYPSLTFVLYAGCLTTACGCVAFSINHHV